LLLLRGNRPSGPRRKCHSGSILYILGFQHASDTPSYRGLFAMAVPNCPADQDLLAFHLGNLPPTALDTVANHLETCQRCEIRLTQMDQKTDAVVAALRVDVPSLPPLYSPVPEDSLGVQANPAAAHLEDVIKLLAPPQQSGEIGWLAHYRIERLLGQGGMGLVFEAEDSHLQRRVAL